MRYINNATRQVVEQRPDRIGGTLNPTEGQYLAAGWRRIIEAAPVADGCRRVSETLVDNQDGATFRVDVVDRLVTDIEAEEQAAAEAAAAQAVIDAEKAAAEAFKASIPRLVLQNIYILLCDTVYGTKDRLKRGTEELLGKAKELQAAGQKDAVVNLAMLVIGLNTELVRAAGIYWWDYCEWCPHPDIVTAAEKKLAEMMQ
jgi:hypothetical protein